MKKLTIPCIFGDPDNKVPFPIYVGEPSPRRHPLHYQAIWLRSERGGTIPPEVIESFGKLQKIALENRVPFEDLCVYALGQAGQQQGAAAQDGAPPPADGAG